MKGGVAVVTGGASGLGKAMAEEAARRGMKVVVADVEAGAMEKAVADLRADGAEAIGVLQKVRRPNKRPQEHHLRVAYALADLYERSGDLAKARDTFGWVAGIDPDFADAQRRARALR